MADLTPALAGVVATGVLLLASAFFSSAEIAIFSLSPEWIEERAATGDRRAGVLRTLRGDPHRLLVTLLVGNNVVNVAISSLVTVLLASYLPPGAAIVAATVVVSLVILVFGEIVPKSVGLGNAGRWAVTVAPAVRGVEVVLSPLITVLEAVTRRVSSRLPAESADAIEGPYLD